MANVGHYSAWVQNTCLSPTDPEFCKNVSEKSKSKILLQAYAVAAEGHDLEHFKKMLSDHQNALEQEIAEREAAAAEKAEKAAAKKNKRKSMEITEDGAGENEAGEGEDTKKSKSSKKRKKDDEDAEKVCSRFEQLKGKSKEISVLTYIFFSFFVAVQDTQDRNQVEVDHAKDSC